MDKRVTIKDVARAAGVSVATVSYVLNNRQDQKISTATRTRVLRIVSEMGYTAARPARSSDQRTGCIAISSCAESGTLLKSDHGLLVDRLVRSLEAVGLTAVLISPERCEKIRRADAVICIDAAEEQCHRMILHNSIPVLGLNTASSHQQSGTVCADYSKIMHQAQTIFGFDFCVVACDTPNLIQRERISAACGSDLYFCRESSDMMDFLRGNGDRPLAVCSPTAYLLCEAAGANAELILPDTGKMCASIADLARQASLGHPCARNELFLF